MKQKALILSVFSLLYSCGRDVYSGMSFSEAEKTLNSNVKIPTAARKLILKKYGSVENWMESIQKAKDKKANEKTETQKRTHYMVSWNSKKFPHHFGHEPFPSDISLLDYSDELGLAWPRSCEAGFCSSCAAKQINGSAVDQSEQGFLTDQQIEQGFILTCVSYPTSNMSMTIGVEEELY